MSESKQTVEGLLFIFDATSGKWGAFVDSAKKVLMIKGCALCTITHGILGEKSDWANCKEELGTPIEYLHRDELSDGLKRVVGTQLPCIVAVTNGSYVMLLTPEVLERCGGKPGALKGKIEYHSAMKGPHWRPDRVLSVGGFPYPSSCIQERFVSPTAADADHYPPGGLHEPDTRDGVTRPSSRRNGSRRRDGPHRPGRPQLDRDRCARAPAAGTL